MLPDGEVWSTRICYWKGLNINTMTYNKKEKETEEKLKCKIISQCSWWKELNGPPELYITFFESVQPWEGKSQG